MNKNIYLPLFFATTLSTIIISSCAGPESYQQKMARYEPKGISKNQVPEIKITNFKFKSEDNSSTRKISRAPASTLSDNQVQTQNQNSKEVTSSTNKKLYFLALYSEYETLKNYSHNFSVPEISICPNFHTGLLRYNDKMIYKTKSHLPLNKKFTYDEKKYHDETYVATRPELLLPLSKEETTPKVIDVIKSYKGSINEMTVNELVHKAIDIHLSKTYSEIKELCEHGASDNYYIYENLITHIKNNNFEADDKNMNILLKTTIFANIALMTSLEKNYGTKIQGRSIASVEEEKKMTYTSEVIARLNVAWAKQYFDYLQQSK